MKEFWDFKVALAKIVPDERITALDLENASRIHLYIYFCLVTYRLLIHIFSTNHSASRTVYDISRSGRSQMMSEVTVNALKYRVGHSMRFGLYKEDGR